MSLPITKNLIAITLFSVVLILCGLAIIVRLLFQDHRETFTRDAVLMISMRIAELHQNGAAPTQRRIDGAAVDVSVVMAVRYAASVSGGVVN